MRKKMFKRIFSVVCVMACGLNLAACAETPEEKIVVDKSEGLPKESILPEEKDTPKDLQIPEYWQETIERSDGFITVEADYQMEIPEIYNTPVYSYEMAPMTDELLNKLCDYFADGNKLYQEPVMTRSELQAEKEKMENHIGDWAAQDEKYLASMIEMVDKFLEKAPDEKEYTYITPGLTAPYQTEKEHVDEGKAFVSQRYSDYYFDTDEEIGMKARVDTGQDSDPMIQVIDYSDKVGSTSNFLFSRGNYLDEIRMEHSLTNLELFDYSEEHINYLYGLKEEMDQPVSGDFTEEKAIEKAKQILKELSLEDYMVTDCYKAIGRTDSDSWAGLDEDVHKSVGYSLYLAPIAGDLAGYEQPFQRPFSGMPETIYAPSFSTEQIHMIITEEGIGEFEWTNISQKKEEIAANTKLLTFDEIKEKMADHLFYAEIAASGDAGQKAGDQHIYKVRDVQLRAANIPAYEDPGAAWLVPVWVFELEYEVQYSAIGLQKLTDKVVVLNAIDGGYVQPRLDVRIPIP